MVERRTATSTELDALRELGIRLMIDDFGAGYSSLAQLHRLDVDVLKVDQAFTHSLAHGSEGEQLYRAIVSMAAALDMHVVAEGVETLQVANPYHRSTIRDCYLPNVGCSQFEFAA
jgi:EAL domain-containing protein (putative c-di-GMP-specific phosphodiesterase class I)